MTVTAYQLVAESWHDGIGDACRLAETGDIAGACDLLTSRAPVSPAAAGSFAADILLGTEPGTGHNEHSARAGGRVLVINHWTYRAQVWQRIRADRAGELAESLGRTETGRPAYVTSNLAARFIPAARRPDTTPAR